MTNLSFQHLQANIEYLEVHTVLLERQQQLEETMDVMPQPFELIENDICEEHYANGRWHYTPITI